MESLCLVRTKRKPLPSCHSGSYHSKFVGNKHDADDNIIRHHRGHAFGERVAWHDG